MKHTLTALFVVLLFATIVVPAAERAAKQSAADILIARINADYTKALSEADASYEKFTSPLLKRYGDTRDRKILGAGSNAIKRLNLARTGVSELDGVRMEQEIAKIRKSMDDQFGNAPKVSPKASVLAVCGASFKGHTYLTINSNANWKEANELCRKMGGHLAYIETAEELVFLTKASRGRIWVGATDEHKEGDWRWGNGKPVSKALWGEPNPSNTRGSEHYAVLATHKGKRLLNDVPLKSGVDLAFVIGFICEWE
ncbi:MAG: C-type lectin domain-containing protein [Phycisphaerae bacterium]|nr:C-type lectin domain-containing protein [Phycisphaerae bacterium]